MLNRYRNVKTEDLLYLVGHEQKHVWYQYQSENESIVSVCDAFDWLTDIYICRFWSVMSRNTFDWLSFLVGHEQKHVWCQSENEKQKNLKDSASHRVQKYTVANNLYRVSSSRFGSNTQHG